MAAPLIPSLADLLQKGYFPRELPPPFKTHSFAAYAPGGAAAWSNASKNKWTGAVSHNLARPGGLRRPLQIPNPVSYFVLADIMASNWADIRAHTWRVRLSASRPYVLKGNQRAVIARYKYSELSRLRSLRRRGSRYLLRSDITQCYPSIYTHAVGWAMHTKAICKALLPGGGHLLGNKIDKALRGMNEGQTHGILIGPDTSLVVAEIVLAAIDDSLITQCPGLIRGFRHVDDYELSFATLRDAEAVRATLQGLLAEYGLFLNPRKTSLLELPAPLEDGWGTELRRFNISDKTHPVAQRNDLGSLLNRAFEIASEYPTQSILRYAVSRLQSLDVEARAWRTFQNCVLGAASADASTVAIALGVLYQVSNKGGHVVARSPLSDVFETLIRVHAPRGQGSEVAWALWGALAWAVPLSDEAGKLVSEMPDNVVALLALHAEAVGLFSAGVLDKTKWNDAVKQPDVLTSENWLLGYEAHQQGWLVTPAVAADPVFAAMSAAAVSFYDLAEAKPQFPLAARGIPGGLLPNYYA